MTDKVVHLFVQFIRFIFKIWSKLPIVTCISVNERDSCVFVLCSSPAFFMQKYIQT